MLTEERHRLHALPDAPYTAARGDPEVSWSSTVSFGGVTYSVPHTLADETVWVRVSSWSPTAHRQAQSRLPATSVRRLGSDDRRRPLPASARLGRSARRPKPTSAAETEFLAIGAAPAPGSLKQLPRARAA